MKKNDNRGLFDIFKKGERDDLTFSEKLVYWFKNVYWCNYKGLTFLALFGIICAIVFVGDVIGQDKNDMDYVIAGSIVMTYDQLDGIEEYFTANAFDANENGKVTLGYQSLPVGGENSYDQMNTVAEEKLFISLADDRVLFYIVDGVHMESMANDGAFEPLSTFGIESEGTYCVEITDSKLFRDLEILPAEGGWYAGIKVIDGKRVGNEKIAKKYEVAAKVLKTFLK